MGWEPRLPYDGRVRSPAIPKIELRSVSKSFRTDRGPLEVLAGVSLSAAPGEFVSVIGPSGCGKSTLFTITAGLEIPGAGDILVDGEVVTGRVDRFAFMPQKDLLLPWRRVVDNTTLGLEIQGVSRKDARARVAPLFTTFGLAGFERAYPFQLSGGMRQRAALLRTVVQDRTVLLLDEPFGALDSLTRTDMQIWLESVWEEFTWTVVLITHDIPEAIYLSDRVYVLSPRPARVAGMFDIDLPRPRDVSMLTSPRFTALQAAILACLRGSGRDAA
jgi:ABC-type nitrate/sulfonate/bicarbonate transport system ATPase subunit